MRLIRLGLYCLPFIILLTIFTFSSQDAPTSAALSKELTTAVNDFVQTTLQPATGTTHAVFQLSHSQIRDLAHISLFFLFSLSCMLVCTLLGYKLSHRILYTLILGFAGACLDEWIQLSSPGRAFEIMDIAKDMLGVCLGISVVCLLVLISIYLIKPLKNIFKK